MSSDKNTSDKRSSEASATDAASVKAEKKAARRERASRNSVDSVPLMGRLFPLGLQHVLAMYARGAGHAR